MTDKSKTVGQAMLCVNQVLLPLRLYGMGEYVDGGATPLLKELLGQVFDRGAGKDVILEAIKDVGGNHEAKNISSTISCHWDQV